MLAALIQANSSMAAEPMRLARVDVARALAFYEALCRKTAAHPRVDDPEHDFRESAKALGRLRVRREQAMSASERSIIEDAVEYAEAELEEARQAVLSLQRHHGEIIVHIVNCAGRVAAKRSLLLDLAANHPGGIRPPDPADTTPATNLTSAVCVQVIERLRDKRRRSEPLQWDAVPKSLQDNPGRAR